MARCGRCGLWAAYPPDHKEQRYSGTCLWFQHRLHEDEVFEDRDCGDFFEAIPGASPFQHFDYKLRRDELGRIHTEMGKATKGARRALVFAVVGLMVSLGGLILKLADYLAAMGGG